MILKKRCMMRSATYEIGNLLSHLFGDDVQLGYAESGKWDFLNTTLVWVHPFGIPGFRVAGLIRNGSIVSEINLIDVNTERGLPEEENKSSHLERDRYGNAILPARLENLVRYIGRLCRQPVDFIVNQTGKRSDENPHLINYPGKDHTTFGAVARVKPDLPALVATFESESLLGSMWCKF
jgi:hypothetical protein